jgi:starvation-inducible outer membrane lipoprotein
MKLIIASSLALILSGCVTTKDQVYYETAKSISRDNTVAQTACWSAISDIAKGGDSGAKVGAIALAEKCKNETVKIEAPKRNWLGF